MRRRVRAGYRAEVEAIRGATAPSAARLFGILAALTVVAAGLAGEARAQATLVASDVTSVAAGTPSFADPTLIHASTPLCPSQAGNAAQVLRTSILGGNPRALVEANPARPPGSCNPYVLASNVHAEADTIWWVDNQGPGGSYVLWRKPRLANAADAATPLVNFGASVTSAELVTYTFSVFVILRRPGQNDVLQQYDKQTGAIYSLGVASGAPFQLSSMQVDTRYLYWLNAGVLWRNDLTNGNQVQIATGVSSYWNEGYDEQCDPGGCFQLSRVLYGKLNTIWNRYNLDPPFPVYTSPDAGATITAITRDGTRYYFFERRPVPGGGFARNDRLLRLPVGSNNPALLFGPVDNGGPGFDSLQTDLTFLYFRDRQARTLQRIANDAAALPVYALRATGIEITQGIQGPSNPVFLVKGRRTYVRLYAKSDGPSGVPGVGAVLNVFDTNTQEFLGTLRPKNRPNGLLFIGTSPRRMALDASFYFELPLEWTQRDRLTFGGVVNPTGILVENDYGNNGIQTGAYAFEDGARLPLEVISWWYNFNNQLVTGGGLEDYDSLRWIERVFPLPSTGGSITQPGPGLRSAQRAIVDDALATRVDRTHPDCQAFLTPATPTTPAIDNRNMCAASYVLGRIRAMRDAGELPRGRYYYGSIAGAAGVTQFTRGFAPGGDTISMGPMRDPSTEQNYMAHEVAHTLGRGHPASGANPVCPNQDAADPGYPHPQARIGASTTATGDETALAGFDFGDNQYIVPVVKGSSTRGDIMSYCTPYWISDFTYVGIHDWLVTVQPNGPAQAGAPVAGDWLLAQGSLTPAAKTGAFSVVQRRDAVADVPALAPGGWALELRSAGGALLASHPFTPETLADEPRHATFSLVVPFVPGTRSLRIVEVPGGAVAATEPVSAAPPVVSNVALVGAPSPVSGVVTASWSASDPDGDPLLFDVLLSRDGGLSFQPLVFSIAGTTTPLDTASWGGGSALLRVVASDGAQTAVADGAPFTVADKAPLVAVTAPAPDTSVEWGQVVNFTASVIDPQDDPLPDADVVWSNAYRTLGTGRALSVDDLEVGVNVVTATATNAAGLTGQASVVVLVGDDLRLPGPRVSTLPATLPFSLPGGATALQNATLGVVNPGGGVLSYIATSSESWLTVDGTSSAPGTAPQTIAVAVDPSALPDAAVSTAEILVYNALDLTDVVSVPVSVAKGDVVGGNPFVDGDGDGVDDRSDTCPLDAGAPQTDSDGDGVGDACDSCPYAADASQSDVGGLGNGSAPDGIGDACQCGDVNGDGRVTLADAVVIQRSLLVPPTAVRTRPELCDVGGPASPGTQDCTLFDAVTIRRALLVPPSAAIAPVCGPATP